MNICITQFFEGKAMDCSLSVPCFHFLSSKLVFFPSSSFLSYVSLNQWVLIYCREQKIQGNFFLSGYHFFTGTFPMGCQKIHLIRSTKDHPCSKAEMTWKHSQRVLIVLIGSESRKLILYPPFDSNYISGICILLSSFFIILFDGMIRV